MVVVAIVATIVSAGIYNRRSRAGTPRGNGLTDTKSGVFIEGIAGFDRIVDVDIVVVAIGSGANTGTIAGDAMDGGCRENLIAGIVTVVIAHVKHHATFHRFFDVVVLGRIVFHDVHGKVVFFSYFPNPLAFFVLYKFFFFLPLLLLPLKNSLLEKIK